MDKYGNRFLEIENRYEFEEFKRGLLDRAREKGVSKWTQGGIVRSLSRDLSQ